MLHDGIGLCSVRIDHPTAVHSDRHFVYPDGIPPPIQRLNSPRNSLPSAKIRRSRSRVAKGPTGQFLQREHCVLLLFKSHVRIGNNRLELSAQGALEELAVRRITQRVNLFEKILIPTAKHNIQRIQIFLGDAERSAVVRSKLAKRINQKKRQALIMGGAVT